MSAKRDARTHEERLSALWFAFGECKEHAVKSGKVNDCSLNKVADKAKVSKTYLTGVRKFKDKDVSDKYISVNQAIQKWRSDFKVNAEISAEQNIINALTDENKSLKDSVYPLMQRLDILESTSSSSSNTISEKDEEIMILTERLRQAESDNSYSGKVKDFGAASPVARRIISPDAFRMIGGKYVFGDAEYNQNAINNSYDELEKALSRNLKMRLYILVGLPCSGKTTWAKNAPLSPDRHPVVFDSTNLTKVERLQLIHQVRKFKDLPICCVVLDTPMTEIRKRNDLNRTSDRQIPDDVFDEMKTRYEKPDPYKEKWIDELLVVRT